MSIPIDVCLQCEQSRAEVAKGETICGIEDGYEYRELVAEWPRHHWRDWSDSELGSIKPERRHDYRRASLNDIQYAVCEDTIYGHNPVKETDREYGIVAGQCIRCGSKDVAE